MTPRGAIEILEKYKHSESTLMFGTSDDFEAGWIGGMEIIFDKAIELLTEIADNMEKVK